MAAHRGFAHLSDRNKRFRFRYAWGIAGALLLIFAAAPSAHAQDAAEYSGTIGINAGTASSQPGLFRPGRRGAQPSIFLAKPKGPTPQQINRKWFASQAGKKGADVTLHVTPVGSSVWIDGKFVGHAPLTLKLPAGKHKISLLGPRQQHESREIEVTAGKNRKLDIRLHQVYPSTVSIPVFGQPR